MKQKPIFEDNRIKFCISLIKQQAMLTKKPFQKVLLQVNRVLLLLLLSLHRKLQY